MTIEYMNGRISAFREMLQLLRIANPERGDIRIMITHCENQIALDESFINDILSEEAFKHGGQI